jgi:TrpR-related protein YerC/YecD
MNKQQLFYQSFLQLRTEDEVRKYLRDLLTEAEIAEFTERLYVADLLSGGNTYEAIAQKTNMSSTTIARVSKWLRSGKGGYDLVLDRLHHLQSSKTLL